MRKTMLYINSDIVGQFWSCEYITPDSEYDPILIHLQKKFRTTQRSNYEPTAVISLQNTLNQTAELVATLGNNNVDNFSGWSVSWKKKVNMSCIRAFMREIYRRIDKAEKKRIEHEIRSSRRLNHAVGTFEETISPRMIQTLASWYNSRVSKLDRLYPAKKEVLIEQFKEKGVSFNKQFLSEFIDELKEPAKFTKEWGVSCHEDGRRKTNTRISDDIKKNIEIRRLRYTKQPYIYASIRGMPQNVESLISEFL